MSELCILSLNIMYIYTKNYFLVLLTDRFLLVASFDVAAATSSLDTGSLSFFTGSLPFFDSAITAFSAPFSLPKTSLKIACRTVAATAPKTG